MAIPTNSVSIGDTTKKSHYDTLYNNAILCDTGGVAGGAQTVPGKKDFSDGIGVDYLTGLSAGNVIGINTTDLEAWNSSLSTIEFKSTAIISNETNQDIQIISNAYYDSAWKYKSTAEASRLYLLSGGTIAFQTASSGTIDTALTWVSKFKVDNAIDAIGIGGYAGGSNRDSYFYFATDAYIHWDESADDMLLNVPSGGHIVVLDDLYPYYSGGQISIGDSTYYFNDVNAKDFLDRSAIWIENPDKAYKILKNARNEETTGFCRKVESRGQHRLKYSDFPDYCWDNALKEATEDVSLSPGDVFNTESFSSQNLEAPALTRNQRIISAGQPTRMRVKKRKRKNEKTGETEKYNEISMAAEGFSLSAGISILMGAVQKLIQTVEAQQIEINELKGVKK